MRIQFVNHSSFVVHTHDISLLCDFWKDGSAFNNGWELLCKTEFDYPDFEGITHLWISHEHPDHFSPPNLSSIPEELRSGITVLFQKTEDRRVVSFCKKLNFADVIEMQPYEPIIITEGVELICAPFGASFADVDSWLCIRTPSTTLLNINDCEFETDDRIGRIQKACGPIDFLATQFSFASKQGDKDDPTWIGRARQYHLDKMKLKVSSFSPTYTLPFASFVYWSHIENRYLNEGAVRVHEAVSCISDCDSSPIVMYPQDEWTIGESWDNQPSLEKYAKRYEWIATQPDTAYSTSESVDMQTLKNSAKTFLEKMTEDVSLLRVKRFVALQHSDIRFSDGKSGIRQRLDALWSGLTSRYEHSRIFVEDHQKSYVFSLDNGLTEANLAREDCHISIGSQSLNFCFSVAFGGETLQVNGRFQNIAPDGWKYLRCVFFLARRIEQKFPMPRYVLLGAISRNFGLSSAKSESTAVQGN